MNIDLTNSTSQVNDPGLGEPGIITWLSLPNSIEASRSRLRAPPYVTAAPPPYVSASPSPYVRAAPSPYVRAAPSPYVRAAPPPNINASSQLIASAALAFINAPQVPLNYSKTASQAQSTAASKNSMSSSAESNQHASSREQAYVARPAFSLADSHEGGHKLQNVNVPQTTSNDSHQFAPVIRNMQTWSPDDFSTNFLSVSGPKVVSTQEPQICIGSVFSLADSHIEHHTGQHETENGVGHIAIDNYTSQQTLLEHPVFHHQNKTISAEKDDDTVLSQFHTTLSTKRNQYSALCSALNSPVHVTLPLDSIINNIHQIITSKNSVSVEVSSPKDDSQLLGCGASIPTSAAHQRSTSAVTSIKDAQLLVSQKYGSIITETEKKTTDVLRGEETHEKPASVTTPQDSSSTSQMLPNSSKVQEPEIVDLDIEDIDDCMLVKIDLNRHHLSYGSKIHNSEVVIDDSDNDEDVTKETSVPSEVTSSGKCDEQKSSASSTVVVGENNPYGTTGSVSMEVEEINTEASKTNSEQTAATYTMSSTGQTHVTSVMSTRTNTQLLSNHIYSEDSCSTWSAPEIENPESELIDLHVGDDAALSTVEYVTLNAFKPSQPDANVFTSAVIQSMLSFSSHLTSTSDIPILKESYCNPFLKPAVQDQIIENMLRRSEIPLFSSHEDARKGQVSQMIDSSNIAPTVPRRESHHIQLNSAAGEITNSKRSRKLSLKGQALKSNTPVPRGKAVKSTSPRPKGTAKSHTLKIKIPSAARTHKKSPSYSDINFKNVESSRTSTETDSSVVCKLCFMVFSSRMELVTHTFNWHRSSQFVEYNLKCDECGKCFSNSSLLELHKKVKCTSSNTTNVDPGTKHVSLDSILHTLIKQNRVNGAPEVSSSSATFRGGVEPQPSTAGLSSGSAAIDISNSTHVDVSSVLNSFTQRDSVSNYSTGVVTEAATDKHPDFVTGDKPMSEELMQEDIKPVITSSGELLQRSDGPDQVLAGGHTSVTDSHKCTTCQKMFSNSFQLSLHQQVSEGCKVARNDCIQCFVCAKSFTSSIIRYLHVLNNPECKEKVDRYCNMCSYFFNSLADKQNHLRMFTACRIYEQSIMKDIVKDPLTRNVGHVEQNVKKPGNRLCPVFTACEISQPDKSPALAQENNNSMQATYSSVPNSALFQVSLPDIDVLQQHSQKNPTGKSHSEKTKGGEAIKQMPYVKPKTSIACPACNKKFATSMTLIFHFNESPKCRMTICSPSIVDKKISASEVTKNISASEVAKQISASEVARQISASEVTKNISAPDVAKQISAPEVAKQISASEVAKQMSASEVAKQMSASDITKQISASEVAIQISASEVTKNISASEVAKQISASEIAKKISASDRINVPKPVATPKSPGRASTDNAINCGSAAATASRNVFCDISSAERSLTCKFCGAEFISENELTHHTEQKCRKLQNTKAVPQLKNLRIVLSRVSVMCQVCHLPFADDIKLAEHLHLDQPCQKWTSETVTRVLELKKSHLDIDALKRDGKRRSCEIVTGISDVTSTISMPSSKGGCIALAEQMPAMDNVINEKLAKGNNGHISSNLNTVNVCDQGNVNDESKGHADDSNKDELISSMSSSDEGSDMEESGSSSEEGNRDYTCKQCCKTYTSKSLLIKHNKSHHKSAHSKRTHCKVCTRKFHDLTGLQAHLLQFKFCFIPLTRPLWERKQDPQICSMCKKVLGSPKDLRKHCFKKMACRLRYINMVLKNTQEKDNANVLPAAEVEIPVLKTAKEKDNTKVVPAAEAVLEVSNTGKEHYERSANEVSSSVQDYCNPAAVDSSSSGVDIEDETGCIKISHVASKPLIECLNCNECFDDFQEHLLKQQSCLDFFGIHANKCPVPVPFCYQCKTHFDDIGLLKLHACKGFVAYTNVCQTCGLKFTSAHNLHAHVQQSLTCNKTNLSSPQKNNRGSDCTFVDSSVKNHQGEMFASSSAVRDVPTSSGEQFFHCLICDARFATLRLLMEHSYQHVEEIPISCDRCSITFIHYNQFVSHQAFHIRMDKEANILVEIPQLSTFGDSTSTDKNVKEHLGSTSTDKDTRAQNSETMTNNGSACIFCHQEFGSVKAKLAHLTSDHVCLAIMRYIIENKLFIHDQGGTEPFDRRIIDSNHCEFCNQSFPDKFYHYLNSACLGRLEPAIQKYRFSPHPTQRQEIDSAVSQTEHKETDTHRVVMKHQGEQQLSGEASASRDPTSSTGGFPEETCCLNCGQCFWTMIEVKEHLSLCGHKHLLPRSVMESADWQMLRCKVCNLKYVQRHALFNHMVNEHSNKVNVLFHELGYTSCCSLCNQTVMSSSMQHHFQQHKKKFVEEIRGKSQLPLEIHSVELCIVCNREYSSRKYLLRHIQRHTHADIFTPESSKASPIINSRKCSVGSSPKHEEDQKLGSIVESAAASSNKVGSCKLCGKKFALIRYYYSHFKRCHKEYDQHSKKQWFMPLVDLKQGSSPTKTITSSKKQRAAFQKYKCKLCRRAFGHLRSFVNHISLSHEGINPERQEEFLEKCKVTESLNENDDFEMHISEYVRAVLKSHGKPQFSKTGFSSKTVRSQPKIVSCKVCNKQFSKVQFFKGHFTQAHRKYNVANWEDVFNVIGTAHPDSTNTEAAKSFRCRQSASEKLKLEHVSTGSKSKNVDSAAFDSDVQNDSLPSISQKTALLQPLGSCKLCHKKFTNMSFFKFHLKKSHSRFSRGDQKNLFKAFTPSCHGEDFKNCDKEDSANFTSVKSQKQNVSYPIMSKAISMNRFKLLRVCCVCQVTFRDVSLYQEHLRTHLKPCSIKLEDIHSQLIPNMPGIAKDCIDIQMQIEDDTDKDIVITDEQSDDGCLYPDSTTSGDARSVQTRILDKRPHSQHMPTPAEYSSFLELSRQDQLKNSAGDCDFTNTERPKTNQGDSVTNESCVDFVIDSSQSGLSAASDKNDCVISKSGLLDMFSDDVSNKDNRNEMAGSTFGEIVHSIVDTLLGDCLTDHSNEKSKAGAVSVTGNSSTEPQFNQISPDMTNLGLKRKAHEAGLDQELCSEIKRHNLSHEKFCKDQVINDSSHVSVSDSWEKKTCEVDPDEGHNLEPQGHAINCETLQLSDSVGVDEQAINEQSRILENTCEMREVDEVDFDEVQSIENQSCEMSCGTQLSTVCKDDPVSCEDDLVIDKPSDKDKEDWGKKTSEIDKDNGESSEFCESNLTNHSNEKSEAGAVSVTGNSSTEPQFNHTSSDVTNLGLKRKAHEAGLDQEQCSEIKRHNLSEEMFCKDQVTNDSGSDSCETKTAHEVDPDEGQNLELQGHAINCETLQLSDSVVAEEQAINEPSHISENTCEMREVDEVDSDEVQSIENQSCEMSCGTQLSTVCKDDPISCEDDLVIDKPSDKNKEDWGKKTSEIDKENGESSELNESNLIHDTFG